MKAKEGRTINFISCILNKKMFIHKGKHCPLLILHGYGFLKKLINYHNWKENLGVEGKRNVREEESRVAKRSGRTEALNIWCQVILFSH